MVEKKTPQKKISMSNTKQEMLNSYEEILKQLQEKDQLELRPAEMTLKIKTDEILSVADSISSESVVKCIGDLRAEIGKMLIELSDRLEEEVNKYRNVKGAIENKNRELKEIYEIDKNAQTLAALIESQSVKRQEFEQEMDDKGEEFNKELEKMRDEQQNERIQREEKIKAQEIDDSRTRQRKKEEYEYTFKREQQIAKDKFEDEKEKREREILATKEEAEKQLDEREKYILEKEQEFHDLQKKVDSFPKEIDTMVNKAIKETTDRLQSESKNREELLKKTYEGEKNVAIAKIESLERATKEQKEQISKLSHQLEDAYQKVQNIAVKTVTYPPEAKQMQQNSQQSQGEYNKKQSNDK
ncbi:MAG: hypothetical protein P9M13_10315 [Candidatus Ancaeobacter aquaticus]|nr:hypothetical protein [Candidatus Ancaeobacter aquaticus]